MLRLLTSTIDPEISARLLIQRLPSTTYYLSTRDSKAVLRRVESYQKKLNITKPYKTFPEIKFKEPYTPLYDPPGIIYEDVNKQKRVLRADELYKFSDGTLKSVRDEIHHRVLEFCLDYNTEMPTRKWTVTPLNFTMQRNTTWGATS
ncbi:hypothetical protein Tco_0370175 [Tanacetum coccineum]